MEARSILLFAITWLVLAVLYRALLSNTQAPVIKRWFIVASPLLAIVITQLPWYWVPASPVTGVVHLPTMQVSQFTQVHTTITVGNILSWAFILVAVLMLLRTVKGILEIIQLRRAAKSVAVHGINVLVHQAIAGPFSFFHWIFIPSTTAEQEVLLHEKLHGKLGHSVDILLWEFLKPLLWWHPAWWILRKEIELNHEHQVDLFIRRSAGERYESTLIRNAVTQWMVPLSTPFAKQTQLKKRLEMMKRRVSVLRNAVAMSTLLLVSISVVAVLQMACSKEETQKVEPTVEQPNKAEEAYTITEQMPQFPGGTKAMFQYFASRVKYPKELEAKNIEGVVFVSFIVDTDGSIRDVELLRGIADAADQQALEITANMPNWEPGYHKGKAVPVKFNLPIRFTLE